MSPKVQRAALLAVTGLSIWWIVVLPRLVWASPAELWWATALYGLCGLPTVLFVGGHPCRIPLMPIWGFFYFVMFGSAVLSQVTQEGLQSFDPALVSQALQLTVLGAALILLMVYSPLGHWVEWFVPAVRVSWDPRRAPRIGVLLALVGLVANVFRDRVPLALAQTVVMGTQFGIIGILCLFLLQLRGQLTWPLTLFLWGIVVPIQVLMGLGSGFLYQVVWVFVPMLLCYAAERRTLPWKAILVTLVCLLSLSGAKQGYREVMWREGLGETLSPVQRGWAFIQMALLNVSGERSVAYESAAETTQLRASQLITLVAVLETTPSAVPFWNGETYADFFWSFLPRMVFPNKPERILGHTFGQRYGFLDPDDIVTSYNVPYQVIEMYINFGVAGVLIGMLLIGLVYRATMAYLAHPKIGERELIIGCTVCTTLLNAESNFSLVFGGVCWLLVISLMALRILAKKPGLADEAESS